MWLSKERTSPFQLYQFFIRIKDSDVQKLLMLFTFETMPKILEIMNEHWKTPEKRIAQKVLATSIVKLVHGGKFFFLIYFLFFTYIFNINIFLVYIYNFILNIFVFNLFIFLILKEIFFQLKSHQNI